MPSSTLKKRIFLEGKEREEDRKVSGAESPPRLSETLSAE
jgi:hypothetical protein